MSDIIATTQSQEIDSEFIELYDLEYSEGNFAYFYPGGLDEDLTTIEFKDSAGVERAYTALPMEAESFSISSDGAYNRPTITVANIESVFSTSIGGLSYEDLIGQRITRRTTLKKYLQDNDIPAASLVQGTTYTIKTAGNTNWTSIGAANNNVNTVFTKNSTTATGTGTADLTGTGAGNAPVEFPKQVYVIDTIKSKNILSVKFELAAPFDVTGIQLPTRVIIGNACPFKYKGADLGVTKVDRIGGCDWDANFVKDGDVNTVHSLYVSKNDEYIVPRDSVDLINWTTGATSVVGKEYKLAGPLLTKLLATGGRSVGNSTTSYWQAVIATTDTPADNNANWRRIRVHRTYSSSLEYIGYTDTRYNEYVIYGGKLWQVKRYSVQGVTPIEGAFWTEGDICSKSLTACKKRFHAVKLATANSGYVAIETDSDISLPFGGYPGALQRR